MFWKKAAATNSDVFSEVPPESNRSLFAPGAGKLLWLSIQRVEQAQSIDDLDTILFHAIEGAFASQRRSKEYIESYSEKLWDDDRDYDDCEQLLKTLFQSLLDQIESAPPELALKEQPRTGKVFVVHGHDLGIRDQVCELLKSLSLVPVVLAETAGSSQTIIELVERHGRVDHAVCLLTPDDTGNARNALPRPRARQNVVWEVGYFFGLLGRNKVSIVADNDVELPSNILGLRPIVLNSSTDWRERLKADLALAGTL